MNDFELTVPDLYKVISRIFKRVVTNYTACKMYYMAAFEFS